MSQHTRAAISTFVLFGVGALAYRNVSYSRQLNYLTAQHGDDSEEVKKLQKPGQTAANFISQWLPSSPIAIAVPLTALWTWRSFRAVQGLLRARFADAAYQLTRPDVLRRKIFAWKFLATPLFVIPVAGVVWGADISRKLSNEISDFPSVAEKSRDWTVDLRGDHVREFLKSVRASDLVCNDFC
jgi:hypothetical protein